MQRHEAIEARHRVLHVPTATSCRYDSRTVWTAQAKREALCIGRNATRREVSYL